MKRRNTLFNDYLYLAHRLDRQKAAKFCARLGPRVLDVGCGYRPYADLLPRNTVYVGMDDDAERRPDLVGTCLAIPAEDASFDSAMCNHVIEHVPRPWDALREINRVLKPGGLLYLTVPQTWGLHYEPHDFYRYTKYGLAYLLGEAGFEVVECEPMGGLFSFLAVRLIDLAVVGAVFPFVRWLGLRRGQYRLGALLFLPANLVAIPCTTFLDKFDPVNQYAWAVLARRLPSATGAE
jgi:SAM-dependent methyltransferase